MEGLTLVPPGMAQQGRRFSFVGPNDEECQGCPFRKLCFNLEPGGVYEVSEVRQVRHPCRLHDGEEVQVVRVVPAPFVSSVEAKKLRGTAVTWQPVPCGYPKCPQYGLCHPVGPARGQRYQVEDEGAMDCPAGFELRRVRLTK